MSFVKVFSFLGDFPTFKSGDVNSSELKHASGWLMSHERCLVRPADLPFPRYPIAFREHGDERDDEVWECAPPGCDASLEVCWGSFDTLVGVSRCIELVRRIEIA